jgi:hypothetical protein
VLQGDEETTATVLLVFIKRTHTRTQTDRETPGRRGHAWHTRTHPPRTHSEEEAAKKADPRAPRSDEETTATIFANSKFVVMSFVYKSS